MQFVINFSTPPEWLFATNAPVTIPSDPNQVIWNYEQGILENTQNWKKQKWQCSCSFNQYC